MARRIPIPVLVVVIAVAVVSKPVMAANGASEALRHRAFQAAYNLDHDEAVTLFRQAIAADPNSSAAYRGLATAEWLEIVFRRGAATVDHYLGSVTQPKVSLKKPPPELASGFRENLNRALRLAEQQVRANRRDIDAKYDLGAAYGLLASYTAVVDGQILSAFNTARRAYNEHEDVLQLDPRRTSAALIVGTYRYVVAGLNAPTRWMAYVAGFGGGKERGLQLIEQAAITPGDAQTDARFGLIILYNRERRYADALRIIEQLQREYPRNRLLWLEAGATTLRSGRPGDAERWLSEGIDRLQTDRRLRMFGEESLWYYKRGAARVAMRKFDAAMQDLSRALGGEAQDWVRGRAHIELGRIAAFNGDRARARAEYEAALTILQTANDPAGEREARILRTSSARPNRP